MPVPCGRERNTAAEKNYGGLSIYDISSAKLPTAVEAHTPKAAVLFILYIKLFY